MAKQPTIPVLGKWIRMTMFMSGPKKSITESHWYNSQSVTDMQSVLNLVVGTTAAAIAYARWWLLADPCTMDEVRVSQENVYKDSLVSTVPLTFGTRISASNLWPLNTGNDCLEYRIEGTQQYRKSLFLGLIPDGVIQGGQYAINNPAATKADIPFYFDGKMQAYFNALAGTPPFTAAPQTTWGTLVISKDPTLSPRCNIVDVSYIAPTAGPPATAAVLTVDTMQPHLLVVNPTTGANPVVRLSGLPAQTVGAPLNQLFQVASIPSATRVNLAVPTGFPADDFVLGVGGKLQNQIRVFQPYTAWYLRTASTRLRGGRTNLQRGRSLTRKILGY